MPAIRYVGTSAWNRSIFDNDGKFVRSQLVKPGEKVDVSDRTAEAFLAGPRAFRNFVEVNGSEDTYGDNHEPDRRASIADGNNATPYPELDMGSTVTGGKAIFVTADENPQGFEVADVSDGPQSDNTDARINAEANAAAEKARADEKAKLTKRPAHPAARPSSNQKSEG
jgi:hypothetical protein